MKAMFDRLPASSFRLCRHHLYPVFLFLALSVFPGAVSQTLAQQLFTVTASASEGGNIHPEGKQSVGKSATPAFLAVPDKGHSLRSVRVGTNSLGASPLFRLPPVESNTKVTADFARNPFVSVVSEASGRVAPSGRVEVPYGGSQEFSITPNPGFEIASIRIGSKQQPIQSTVTITNITKSRALTVTFQPAANRVVVQASVSPKLGGTIQPSERIAVLKGESAKFLINPEPGFRVVDVAVDGKSVGAVTEHTLTNLQKASSITASFARLPAITVNESGGGIISPDPAPSTKLPVAFGADQTFSIEPKEGFVLKNLVVNGETVPAASSYTFAKVTKNQSFGAVFAAAPGNFTVSASAGAGGEISPSGRIAVPSGGSAEFSFAPSEGFQIDKVLFNGKAVALTGNTYTAANITQNAEISVSFKSVAHIVKVSSARGGRIQPSGDVRVPNGKGVQFTVTPPPGQQAAIFVDGILMARSPAGKNLTYRLTNVKGPRTVEAVYVPRGKRFAGSLTVGLIGLGESIFVANSSPGTFEIFAQGSLGLKSLLCWSERLGKWLPVTRDDLGGTAEVPFLEGDNPLVFAAVANDGSIAWYDTTITYYPDLDFTTPLTPSVTTVDPNRTTNIRWTVGLLNAAGATVKLYAENEAGQRTLVGQLRDNGQLPDEIQGDGIFSGEFTVSPLDEGYLYFRAGVEKDGINPYFSELAEIWSANPVTDTQVTTAVELGGAAKALYDSAVNSGKTPQEAAQAATTALSSDPDIGIAGATKEGGVWWVTKDGLLGCYAPKGTNGVRRGSGQARLPSSENNAITTLPSNSGSPTFYRPEDWNLLFPQMPASVESFEYQTFAPLSRRSKSNASANAQENRINSDRAVIHSPNYYQWGPLGLDDSQKPWPTIEGNKGCGLYGTSADKHLNKGPQYISIVKSFGDYGYIHICSHGDNFYDDLISSWEQSWGPNGFLKGNLSLVGLWSEASLVKNSNGAWEAGVFADDIKNKRVAIAPNGEIFLLPAFFKNRLPSLPNSLVVIAACRSGYNSSLAKEFLAKGAASVIGYTDYVKSTYCQNTLQEIIDRMYEDKPLGEAVSSARGKYGVNDGLAALVFFGASDLKFPLSSLKNGGFEEGVLTPWTKVGDGRVFTALGGARPTEGTYMGIISTGLGYTTAAGSIEQRICVPAGGGDLQLDWNFFSEEWLEYVGSIYQDTFQISVAVADQSGNKGSYQSLFTQSIDGLAAGVSASDVSFDQGGVYNTGWRTTTLNLDAYAGKTVFLRFYSTDVGDSIYDSAILLDNIRFAPRSAP